MMHWLFPNIWTILIFCNEFNRRKTRTVQYLNFWLLHFDNIAEVTSTEDRSDVPNSDGEDSSESDDDLDEAKADEHQAETR